MASVTLKGLRKTYDTGAEVIRGIDLEVADGEFMVFVGPSGCGKSTLLRMIAGLEDISGGELYFDDRLGNHLAPVDRGVAMVFQSYALYPHMTVAENMGFSLKLAGRPKAEIREAVGRAAEILRITHLLERKPKALSGGQRQRVAIGRAIVRKPGVFLFDEPLSNLDASLRVAMRVELARLHRDLGSTMIYVTHDQTEAMTLGDRIAVFHKGSLEQVGPPMELYREPVNTFVGEFLGSPTMNLLEAGTRDGALRVAGRDLPWEGGPLPGGLPEKLTLGVRPEHLDLLPPGTRPDALPGVVEAVERLGDCTLVHVTLDGVEPLVSVKRFDQDLSSDSGGRMRPPEDWRAGARVDLRPRMDACLLFREDGGRIGGWTQGRPARNQ